MIYWSFRILRTALAWVGFIAVCAIAAAFVAGPAWCAGDTCTVQGWLSALSGWVAAAAAAATIGVLLNQTRAAHDALSHARETAERQLRAYIFISDTKLEVTPDAVVRIQLKNTGQTPAYHVRLGLQCTAGPAADLVFEDPLDGMRVAFDMGPGATQTAGMSIGRFLAMREHLETGIAEAFFNGLVLYRDAFGVERTTRFRLKASRAAWAQGGKLDAAADGNMSD